MSTAFDTLATQATTMERVYNDLKQYHIYCTSVVSGTFDLAYSTPDWIDGDPGQKQHQLNALSTYGTAITKLGTTLRSSVLNNTYSFANWSAYAKELRAGMSGIIKDVSSWSFSGILDSTLQQTGEDIEDIASTGLKFGSFGVGAALVVVLALALLVYGPKR